jgi:SAM-dependent methyltransferase
MTPNEAQREHWNSGESAHWVDHADRYDRQLQPFADAIFDSLALEDHHTLLDVGCGCGSTTLTAARHAKAAMGIDLSEPMLDVARTRAREAGIGNAEFVSADAQTHHFNPAGADRLVSRFGVMFFDDPTTAFANLRSALRDDGQLAFVSWQPLEANEWLLLPGIAASAHVELPAIGSPDGGPGMFSLADKDRIHNLLADTGYTNITIETISPTISLAGGGTLDESLDFLLGTGIARALLDPASPDARLRAVAAVRDVLAEHYDATQGVRLGTGAWLVQAHA